MDLDLLLHLLYNYDGHAKPLGRLTFFDSACWIVGASIIHRAVVDYRIFNVRMPSSCMRMHTGNQGLQSHPTESC